MIDLRVDAREAISFFDSLSRQTPYAISVGINGVMMNGQRDERARVAREFIERRPDFINRSIKILQFAKKDNLIGVIGIDPAHDVLSKFEAGGMKTPRSGSALAVPIQVKRSGAGIVVESMRIRNLKLTAHRTVGGKVQLKGLNRTFTVKGPSGGAVLQRVGRKPKGSTLSEEIAAGSVRVAYAFKRSVPIKDNLQFTETITKAVARDWVEEMTAGWNRAIATAR